MATEEDLLGHLTSILAKIEKFGFVVQHVGGGDFEYTYTAGLTPKGLPELICTGLPSEYAHRLLSSVVQVMLDTPHWNGTKGVRLGTEDGQHFQVRLYPVTNDTLYVANKLYENVLAAQAVWPDTQDRFPGDQGFMQHQPILEGPP